VPLTLDPEVQRVASRALTRGRPFFGATVVLAAKTGEILALAETSQRTPERSGVALRADAPAASIFKLVSAAALLHAGVSPSEPVCYQGGTRRLAPKHLKDRPGDQCVTFADVIPRSLNAAMAKLVNRHLPAGALHGMAERFGFGKTIAIEIPVEPSHAFIPRDPFGRAKTAAGFGDVRLSAFHAAAMTAVIANRGEWIPPRIIDESAAAELGVRLPPGPLPHGVIDPAIADALTHMMVETTESGTARRMMAKLPRGVLLRQVQVGAKTGSLLFYDEHVDHSWLVAFAPAAHPEVVVATVIVNDWQLWYTKAGPVALQALEAGLVALRGRR